MTLASVSSSHRLACGFPSVQRVFPDCYAYALQHLTEDGMSVYLSGAEQLCRMGRGDEPVLVFLEEMPTVAELLGEAAIAEVIAFVQELTRTPNGRAIAPLLQSLAAVARALESLALLREYFHLVWQTMQRTSPQVHGLDKMYSSECLVELLTSVPQLMGVLSFAGFRNWVDYGVRAYSTDPDRQRAYFLLNTSDSRAVVQRERHGTLFVEIELLLDLKLLGLLQSDVRFVPYSLSYDEIRKPIPYFDARGLHLPEVYYDLPGVSGMARYRAVVAHITAHRNWTSSVVADNLSPFQRMAVEVFEDSRVERMAIRRYPGLRRMWLRLHPHPL
jgi:hypothetical protein